jgi:hypothetical protein
MRIRTHHHFFTKHFLFCFALIFFSPFLIAAEEDVQEKIAPLRYESDILSARIKLAKSGKFYLIADIPEKKIHLMMRNISLKEFPVEDVEIGRRVFFFVPFFSSKLDAAKVFTGGAIYPSRVVKRYQIIPPEEKMEESAVEEAPSLPEPPEAKQVIVSHIFRLKFKGGFCLEIHSAGSDEESAGFFSRMWSLLRSKASDLLALLRGGGSFKMKCFLSPEEMRSFYRIVPDDISMLMLMKPLQETAE